MNTIQNYGMVNYNKNKFVNYKFKQNNIAFTSNPIAKVSTPNKKNIFEKFLSFIGIREKFNKQLINHMEEILKDKGFVNRKHSSFRATANDFIYGQATFMQQGLLGKNPIYKADRYYIIQSFDNEGIAIFKKFNRKGKLVDTIQLTGNAL